MIGSVDGKNRALLEIPIANELNGPSTSVTTWIDTAFDGHLVFPQNLINALSLNTLAETEAILADGSKVQLETYPVLHRLVWPKDTGSGHCQRW